MTVDSEVSFDDFHLAKVHLDVINKWRTRAAFVLLLHNRKVFCPVLNSTPSGFFCSAEMIVTDKEKLFQVYKCKARHTAMPVSLYFPIKKLYWKSERNISVNIHTKIAF